MKIKISLTFFFLILPCFLWAQVTNKPRIRRQSVTDVQILKVELINNQTIVSFQYQAPSEEKMLDEFFRKNPQARQEILNVPPIMRQIYIDQILRENFRQTISFQKTAFIRTPDGKRFHFIKAEKIPENPEFIKVKPGRTYDFTVRFERVEPGYELIDLVEDRVDRKENLSYWNFEGISIRNPGGYTPIQKPELGDEPIIKPESQVVAGKVMDLDTKKPLQARVILVDKRRRSKVDSLITSKTGYYEFVVDSDEFVLEVSSENYRSQEEVFDLKNVIIREKFNRDIFLEKIEARILEEIPEPKVEELKVEKKDTITMGEVVKTKPNTFKLDKVYFNQGESYLLPDSHEQLDRLVEYLRENPKTKIKIVGHTDNQGDSKLNKKLSVDRAFTVREYLVTHGIAGNRVKFEGKGDKEPVASNVTEETRKLNRRVEYELVRS